MKSPVINIVQLPEPDKILLKDIPSKFFLHGPKKHLLIRLGISDNQGYTGGVLGDHMYDCVNLTNQQKIRLGGNTSVINPTEVNISYQA